MIKNDLESITSDLLDLMTVYTGLRFMTLINDVRIDCGLAPIEGEWGKRIHAYTTLVRMRRDIFFARQVLLSSGFLLAIAISSVIFGYVEKSLAIGFSILIVMITALPYLFDYGPGGRAMTLRKEAQAYRHYTSGEQLEVMDGFIQQLPLMVKDCVEAGAELHKEGVSDTELFEESFAIMQSEVKRFLSFARFRLGLDVI